MVHGRRPFRFATDAFGLAQSAREVTETARRVEARGDSGAALAQDGVTSQPD